MILRLTVALGSMAMLMLSGAQSAQVSITIDSTDVGPGDPVAFTLTVSNETTRTARLPQDWAQCNGVHIYWRQGQSAWVRLGRETHYLMNLPVIRATQSTLPAPSLVAGRAASLRFWIAYDIERTWKEKRGYRVFGRQGEYSIKATCIIDGENIESAPARFWVTDYNVIDAAAYEYLQSQGATHFLFDRFQWRNVYPLEDGKRVASNIVRLYPGSRFKPWAELYLLRATIAEGLTSETSADVELEARRLMKLEIPVLSAEARKIEKKATYWREKRLEKNH